MPSLLRPLIGRQQGQLQGQEVVRQREAQDAQAAQAAEDRRRKMETEALERFILEQSESRAKAQHERQMSAPSQMDIMARQHEQQMALERLRQQGAQATAQARQQATADSPRPTDFSRRAAFLQPRAEEAARNLLNYYERGPSPRQGMQKVPVIGNFVLSDEQRQMRQAAEVVAAAVLRLESGATITEQEIESLATQMVPSPGDDPGTLAQKKKTLELAMQQLGQAAQPSAGPQGSTGNIDLSGQGDPKAEQRAAYDRAAQALKARGANESQIMQTLGPRP